MHKPTEKGINVTSTEHPRRTPLIQTGALAVLPALLGGGGRGGLCHRNDRWRRISSDVAGRWLVRALSALLILAAAGLLPASSALAASPGKPEILKEPNEFGRAIFYGGATGPTTARFKFGLKSNGSETTYHVEYSLPEAGHAPATNSASWQQFTVGGSGTVTAAEEYVGPHTESYTTSGRYGEKIEFTLAYAEATGLVPETTYYVRVRANNSYGELVQTVYTGGINEVSTFTTQTQRPGVREVQMRNVTTSSAYVRTEGVTPNGSQTVWGLELAESGAGPWTAIPGISGAISQAQAEATPYGSLISSPGGRIVGLKPSTVYYVRMVAENTCEHYCGTAIGPVSSFETGGLASAGAFAIHALHGESLRLLGSVDPNSSPTSAEQVITIEGAPTGGTFALELEGHSTTATTTAATLVSGSSKASIPLPTVTGTGNVERTPGGEAAITDVKASIGEFLPGHPISGPGIKPGAQIAKVEGSTLELEAGSQIERNVPGAEIKSDGPLPPFAVGEVISGLGIPAGTTITGLSNGVDEGAFVGTLDLSAAATSSGTGVSLTANIPYNADAPTVARALNEAVGSENVPPFGRDVDVEGPTGGPYTVLFIGSDANRPVPSIEASGLQLTPPGTVSVTTTQEGSAGYGAHYHFQYVTQQSFNERGWAGAQESPEAEVGAATHAQGVGYDLPGFTPGETYRYRLLAQSDAPGTPQVEGAEQSLTAPTTPPAVGSAGPCSNEAARTGAGARLPDCRAYEQLTPTDKQAAQEPFHYGQGTASAHIEVGESGEYAVLESAGVDYPGGGLGPYLFSRQESGSWTMTPGSPQPETGVSIYHPELYSADATQVAFTSQYGTSFSKESADVEFRLGAVGGPYTTVATVPRGELGSEWGWVAANGSFSKLVLQMRGLLYEYTAEAGLSPLNGGCGAVMVNGHHESGGTRSSQHSISADGSRVFFEAASGGSCTGPTHLYMRVNGETTVDLGAYKFAAADGQGTILLLEKGGKLVGYNTESGTTEEQSSDELERAHELVQAGIPVPTRPEGADAFAHSRYTYFGGSVPGLPGSGVMRYDSVEKLVECISCASPFDPEPKQPALLGGGQDSHAEGVPDLAGGFPEYTTTSANGEFAFFVTTAALLPEDVNGEIEINTGGEKQGGLNGPYFDAGGGVSPSSDIYEWRGNGVDGCVARQGCLALITDGRGGFHNVLLGADDEGRDVFFYTLSELVPQDVDKAGDIYDARIGGGVTPPPPPPVECEGSACSTPPGPPNDATPSSQTFSGPGNLTPAATATPKVSKSKPKKKTKEKRRTKRKRKGGKAANSAGRLANDRRSK